MKRFQTLLFALAATVICLSWQTRPVAAQRGGCMQAEKAGAWISGGLLTRRMFKDAMGRPEPAYILRMPEAECLRGRSRLDNVRPTRTVQVYSSHRRVARQIARYVGKRVMIEGLAFGASTVHHHAPIVVDVSSIDLP